MRTAGLVRRKERSGAAGEERRAERSWLRTGVGRAGRSSDRPAAAAPPAGPGPAAADPAPHARPRPGASSRTRSFQLTGREARLQSSVTAAPALPCPPPAQAYVRACARPPLSTPLNVDPPASRPTALARSLGGPGWAGLRRCSPLSTDALGVS